MSTINDPKGAAGALKTPLGLIPPIAMEKIAWVHKLGADKYGKKVPVYACNDGIELAEFCSCGYSTQNQRAIQKDPMLHADCVSSATIKNTQEANGHPATMGGLHGQKDYVSPATTNNLGFQIQVTIDDKKVLLTTGPQKIKSILKHNSLNIIEDQKLKKEILSTIELELSNHLGCLYKTSPEFCKNRVSDVRSVVAQQEEGGYSTSTTTIKLENLGGSYATDAIKDLACLETILSMLKKHSPTCDVQNLIVRDGEVERYGAFNWRKTGVCATTYVNAILRHLNAWRDGEDLDPESGISHLAHIACGCNILLDADYCNTLQDDRNKIPDKKPYPSLTDFTCIKCGHVKVNHPIYGATCENCDYIGHDPY